MRKICNKAIYIIILIIIIIYSYKMLFNTGVTAVEGPDTYKILVDVEESKLYLFKNNELYKTYTCAGGKTTTPSPIGTWTIISKGKWGEGFGGRWMRF